MPFFQVLNRTGFESLISRSVSGCWTHRQASQTFTAVIPHLWSEINTDIFLYHFLQVQSDDWIWMLDLRISRRVLDTQIQVSQITDIELSSWCSPITRDKQYFFRCHFLLVLSDNLIQTLNLRIRRQMLDTQIQASRITDIDLLSCWLPISRNKQYSLLCHFEDQ